MPQAPGVRQGRQGSPRLKREAMLAGSLPCFAAEQAGGTSTLGATKKVETEQCKNRFHTVTHIFIYVDRILYIILKIDYCIYIYLHNIYVHMHDHIYIYYT